MFEGVIALSILSIRPQSPGQRNEPTKLKPMNRRFPSRLVLLAVVTLLAGCSWHVGGGPKAVTVKPTTGQQLIDLKTARDAGAITEPEYQAQRAKVLNDR